MSAVWLEQLEHPLVGRAWGALEDITHDVRQVVVTHRDRVGVAQRHRRHLGGCPWADAGKGLQPGVSTGHVHRDGFLEPLRAARGTDDRFGAAALDPEPVESPVRRSRESLRRGRQRQPGRAWSRLAQGHDKGSIRRLSLFDRDQLTDHRRDQGFEDRLGAREPQSTMPAGQVGEQALIGTKIAVVVLLPA